MENVNKEAGAESRDLGGDSNQLAVWDPAPAELTNLTQRSVIQL